MGTGRWGHTHPPWLVPRPLQLALCTHALPLSRVPARTNPITSPARAGLDGPTPASRRPWRCTSLAHPSNRGALETPTLSDRTLQEPRRAVVEAGMTRHSQSQPHHASQPERVSPPSPAACLCPDALGTCPADSGWMGVGGTVSTGPRTTADCTLPSPPLSQGRGVRPSHSTPWGRRSRPPPPAQPPPTSQIHRLPPSDSQAWA